MSIKDKKVGFIGCGAMGGALVNAISKVVEPTNIFLLDHNADKLQKLSANTGAVPVENYEKLLSKKIDFLFLASKPQFICQILTDLYATDSGNIPSVIISVAAGISLEQLEATSKLHAKQHTIFVRLMPNTPAQISEGMIALSIKETPAKQDSVITENTVKQIKALLANAGKTEQVSEKLMDAVTAISGSGPAYVYLFIEALADAAVSFGMPREKAYIFAAQTVKGSAAMVLETQKHPGILKDAVCSPGGTTIAAVQALEKEGLRSAIQKGAKAAYTKSCKMSKKV